MDDLMGMLSVVSNFTLDLEKLRKQHFEELDQLLYGATAEPTTDSVAADAAPAKGDHSSGSSSSSVTPQQTKKRAKRLSSLAEDEEVVKDTPKQLESVRVSNAQLLAVAENDNEPEIKSQPTPQHELESESLNTTASLMPPPPAPADTTMNTSTRPQRAAKLRSEKNLKEPPLNSKMRRPTVEEVKVKLEHEQRLSQAKRSTTPTVEAAPVQPQQPNADKSATETAAAAADERRTRSLRVHIKRERLSNESAETTATQEAVKPAPAPAPVPVAVDESVASTIGSKKGKKKKENHRPIKVERFSDLDKGSPISSRTRHGSTGKRESQEPQVDAVDNVPAAPAAAAAISNETMIISNTTMQLGPAPADATFNLPLAKPEDATFAVEAPTGGEGDKDSSLSSTMTMVTAKDSSAPNMDSLMTDDESLHEAPKTKQTAHVKALKMPTRTHELFNPILQSPVKERVAAFENAANALKTKRTRGQTAQQGTPGSGNTPVIGKLPAPALTRFLTPTQSATNLATFGSVQPKKTPLSASKAQTLLKTNTGTNLKSSNSGSTKTLSRENSGDDFRKGLHQLAEERKKQREQKHLLVTQQREAKDRERAERMAKLAKEREEKRQKKLLQERKKQEMEELQRKLKQQEEAEALKKAKAKAAQEQERAMLLKLKQQMQQQQQSGAKAKQQQQAMLPPPPKSKYTFEMLHENDSTDDEGKVSYKRPPVPGWSRSHERGPVIAMQTYLPTDIIDSFFSVSPTTPDLKLIFPNIDPRYLKRNSSVLWSTPPRYSELPEY